LKVNRSPKAAIFSKNNKKVILLFLKSKGKSDMLHLLQASE